MILFRITLKIKEIKVTTKQHNRTQKIIAYINDKYGSFVSFKVLKYFLEHKLAREKNGYATYEMAFNIPPSMVLTRNTLAKIESAADSADEKDSETGVDLLVEKGILTIDKDTGILELAVPLDSIANLNLKETEHGFEEIKDTSSATLILLQTFSRDLPRRVGDSHASIITGVVDMLLREKNGKFTTVENKFGT
jgi:hypothetical protein